MIDLDIGYVINILPRLLTDKLCEAEASPGLSHGFFSAYDTFIYEMNTQHCFNFAFCLTAIQMILITRL